MLHVVLVAPEIPPNTGTIARLCAATRTRLHLIRPLGFSLEDRYLKRAGLDYWPHVDLAVYEDFDEFLEKAGPSRMHFYSARSNTCYSDVRYRDDDYLIFGCETKGLPPSLLKKYHDSLYVIPITSAHVRSLNLSNAASIVVYEALRQIGF